MKVDVSELFSAGLARIFPASLIPAMLNAFRLHARLDNGRKSKVYDQIGDRQFRVMRLYVSQRVGTVRILFEVAPDLIVLWHISRSDT